jgi:hypothetical protein
LPFWGIWGPRPSDDAAICARQAQDDDFAIFGGKGVAKND